MVLLIVFMIVVVLSSIKRWGANTAEDFFLSNRDMHWWAIGTSLFASNIGAEHFVGQAGAAAATGVGVGGYEWTAAFLLILLGWIFYPVYRAANVATIPEYVERRFNVTCRVVLIIYSFVAYIITKIAATLFAGGIVFDVVLGWNMWVSISVIIAVTAIYDTAGGLTAVMYTDGLQALIFTIGGLCGMVVAFSKFGSMRELQETLDEAGLGNFFDILRPPSDKNYPWTGMLIGQIISSIWYCYVQLTTTHIYLLIVGKQLQFDVDTSYRLRRSN
eukprot:gene6426-7703_t